MKPVLHFPRFGKTLLAAALVAMAGTGCSTDQSLLDKVGNIFGTPAEAKTATAAAKPIEGDIDAVKALMFLYGNLQTTSQGGKEQFGMPLSKEWALWKKPQCSNVRYDFISPNCPHEAKVHSVLGAKYTEQGQEKYILLTKTGDNPPAENPEIFGLAVFAKVDGKWALEVEDRYISPTPEVKAEEAPGFGCFLYNDYKHKPSLVRIGPDKHGILIHAMGTGGWGNSECPTVLMPDGGSIRSVLIGVFEHSADVMGIGSGSCKGAQYGEWDVHASFDEKSVGEYYDAIVRYTESDRKCKEKTASLRLQFRDGAYHKVATPKTGKKGDAKKRK